MEELKEKLEKEQRRLNILAPVAVVLTVINLLLTILNCII